MNVIMVPFKEEFDNINDGYKQKIGSLINNVINNTDPSVLFHEDFNCYEYMFLDKNLFPIINSIQKLLSFQLTFEYVMYTYYTISQEIIEEGGSQNYLKMCRKNYIHDTDYKALCDSKYYDFLFNRIDGHRH